MSVVSLRLSVVKIFTDASIPRLRGDFDNLGRGNRETKSKVSLSTLLCEPSGLYRSVIFASRKNVRNLSYPRLRGVVPDAYTRHSA